MSVSRGSTARNRTFDGSSDSSRILKVLIGHFEVLVKLIDPFTEGEKPRIHADLSAIELTCKPWHRQLTSLAHFQTKQPPTIERDQK